MNASDPPAPPVPDEETNLTPDEEAEILRRSDDAEENVRTGNVIPWEALFPPQRLTG